MKVSQFLIGIATGAIAGSVSVLLSTPQSGSELRSSLKTTSLDYKDKLKEVQIKLQDLKSSISQLSKASKEVVPETIEGFKKDITEWKNETTPLQHQLQAEIQSIQLAIEELEKTLPKPKEKVLN
ncbi:YtxH domain-containing protein [Psychrobacillus sp. FJAT-51614]|uniref:YtxH domain-containing protein n=1 Tax=Psychrobacillus mangrovi TaxID=3117745 RepID=A0ABU8F5S6_9BACI